MLHLGLIQAEPRVIRVVASVQAIGFRVFFITRIFIIFDSFLLLMALSNSSFVVVLRL